MQLVIKYFFSIYRPSFIENILYMLQKTEYFSKDFLKWFFKTTDFTQVQKISKLDWTVKIKIYYFTSMLLCFIGIATSLLLGMIVSLYFILGIFLLPVILVSSLLLLNFLFSAIQKSYEILLIKKAKAKLGQIKAFKIAIAGSYGKTSQREILKTVLEQGKKVKTVKDNFNTPLGIANFIESLSGDEEILIFEFGEYYPGDIKYLCEFVEPDLGIITGINEAHLERFKTIENTIGTIFEISDYLGEDKVYVNSDSQFVRENLRSSNKIFSKNGVKKQHGIKLLSQKTSLGGTDLTATVGSEVVNCSMRLLGEHNLAPVLLSMQIGIDLDVQMGDLIRGVSKLVPFSHRMELRNLPGGIVMLDDSYNGNIDGFMVMMDFLRNVVNKRIVYITPGLVEVGNKTEDLHRRIAIKIIETENIKNVVLIENSATKYIQRELLGRAGISVIVFKSMSECLKKLNSYTLPNDLVVVQNDWGDQYQ